MKTFSTNGTGSQQTLSEIESDKMPIYETMADAEADLANLEEGQLVGIEDTGDELSQPVDTVEAGNLHAVTSNAVAEALTFDGEEKEAGYYFGNKRYHKTYVYTVNIVADTQQFLQTNFEIPIAKIVNVDGFATNGSLWFKDLNIHFAQTDNALLIYPKFGGNAFAVVIDVYYIK